VRDSAERKSSYFNGTLTDVSVFEVNLVRVNSICASTALPESMKLRIRSEHIELTSDNLSVNVIYIPLQSALSWTFTSHDIQIDIARTYFNPEMTEGTEPIILQTTAGKNIADLLSLRSISLQKNLSCQGLLEPDFRTIMESLVDLDNQALSCDWETLVDIEAAGKRFSAVQARHTLQFVSSYCSKSDVIDLALFLYYRSLFRESFDVVLNVLDCVDLRDTIKRRLQTRKHPVTLWRHSWSDRTVSCSAELMDNLCVDDNMADTYLDSFDVEGF